MSNLRFHVERCEEKAVSGWGFDPENPLSRLQVEVKSAGHVIGTGVASIMRPDLACVGFGDGKCGFEIPLNGGKGGDPVTITLENPRNAKRAALEDKLTRPEGLVTFPADHARRLSAKGLTLTNARGSLIFARGSYFEPPIVVHSILQNGFIQIGSFTGVYGGDLGSATIGRYCSIAPNVSIGPNEHPTDWLTSSVVAENATRHDWDLFARPGKREYLLSHRNGYTANLRRTTIGHDVWIGTRTLIRKGVTIGDGAIVAGGSVVTQDVPPYAIVAGVPARVKRLRFDERTIERLLALRWWRFAIYDFIDLPLSNIERTLDLLEERLASSSVSEWQPERITPAILQDMIDKLSESVQDHVKL